MRVFFLSLCLLVFNNQVLAFNVRFKALQIRRSESSNQQHGNGMLSSVTSNIANGETIKLKRLIRIPKARRPTFESGLRYRSDDWLRNVLSLPKSFILKRIQFHFSVNLLLCSLVVLAHKQLGFKAITIPMTGHSLLGGFLSLLLVFRTNSAYARFYEARGVWSSVMAKCRGLAYEEVAYLRRHSPSSAARFAKLLAAFPDALAHRCLCGTTPLPPHVAELFPNVKDLHSLEPAAVLCMKMHGAMAAAELESKTSGTNFLESQHLASMTHDINGLATCLATCEKIVQTPVPLSYSRHTSRFLTIWCGTLPFAIVEPLGWFALPVMAIVCWLLFGIEEIGHLIEQPFVPVLGKNQAQDADCERAAQTQPYDIGMVSFMKAVVWIHLFLNARMMSFTDRFIFIFACQACLSFGGASSCGSEKNYIHHNRRTL